MQAPEVRSLAVIANGAFSIVNFRGPLIREMTNRGVRVYALAPDFDEPTRRAVEDLGATPIDYQLDRTGMRPLRDLRDGILLRRLLKRLRPDVTFAYFIKPVIYGSLAARLAGVKSRYSLVAGLGYIFIDEGRPRTLRRRVLQSLVMQLYRLGFSACERVFFQNNDDIRHFVEAGVLPEAKAVRLAGTGVDLDHFVAAPSVTQPIRFLLVARLLREKGVFEFVDAARHVKAKFPDVEFLVAGATDPNPGSIRQEQVDAWNSEGVVSFLGHVDDIRALIAASSVFVLPSYREGMPRCNQEAMAMGRPVITTDVAGCRDTVIDQETGFLVPVRDPVELAAAMLRFVENPGLIRKMGRAARTLAETRFDVHQINEVMCATMGIPPRSRALAEK